MCNTNYKYLNKLECYLRSLDKELLILSIISFKGLRKVEVKDIKKIVPR